MAYLKENNVSKRVLAMLLSLLMVFSMFSMLTNIVGLNAEAEESPTCDIVQFEFAVGDLKYLYDNNGTVTATGSQGTNTQWYKIPAGTNAYGQAMYYLKNVATNRYMYIDGNRLGGNGDWLYYKTYASDTRVDSGAYKWTIINNPVDAGRQIAINNANYNGATTTPAMNSTDVYALGNFNQANAGLYPDAPAPAVITGRSSDFANNAYSSVRERVVTANTTNPDYTEQGGGNEGGNEGAAGKYYVIQSVQRNTFLADTGLNEDGTIRVALSASDWDTASADTKYQWEMIDAGNGKVYLKNVATGRYIQTDGDKYYGYNDGFNHNGVALVDTPNTARASLTLTNTATEGDGKKLYTMHDDEAFAAWTYYINTYHDNAKLQMSAANANNAAVFRFAEYTSEEPDPEPDPEPEPDPDPVAPPVLSITSATDEAVNLSWTYEGSASFNVYRSVNGGAYEKITTTTDKTYTDTNVTYGNTYDYKVTANEGKQDSINVPAMSYTARSGNDTFQQDSLQSDGLYNAGYIGDNNWASYTINAAVSGTYDVTVYLANGNGSTLTAYLNDESNKNSPLVAFENVACVANAWQSYTAYNATINLNAGANTIYFVAGSSLNFWKMNFSIDESVESGDSNVVTHTIAAEEAPELSITATNNDSVELAWTFHRDAKFNIYRSTDGASFEKIGETTGTTYTDTTVVPGTTYSYKIDTKFIAQESFTVGAMDYYGTNEANPQPDKTGNNAFRQDVQQSDGRHNAGYVDNGEWAVYTINPSHTGTYQVTFYQAANDTNVHNSTLRTGSANGEVIAMATFQPASANWQNYLTTTVDVELTAGQQDVYYVAGGSLNFWKMEFVIDENDPGVESNVVNTTIVEELAPVLEIVSIDNVTATANNAFDVTINLKNSGNATLTAGQLIDVTFNGQTQQVTVPEIAAGGTATVYATFTAPAVNSTYEVSAGNVKGTVTVTGGAVIDNFTVTATANGLSAIDLSWDAIDTATSYEIFRSTSENDGYTSLGTVTTNSFADTGLNQSTTYYYKVVVTTASGLSGTSAVASAKTASPEAISGLFDNYSGTVYYIRNAGLHRFGDNEADPSIYMGYNARAFIYDNDGRTTQTLVGEEKAGFKNGGTTSNVIDGLTGTILARKATYDNKGVAAEYTYPEGNTDSTSTYYDFFKWMVVEYNGGYIFKNLTTGRYLYASNNATSSGEYYSVYTVEEDPTTANIDNYTFTFDNAAALTQTNQTTLITSKVTAKSLTIEDSRNALHDTVLYSKATENIGTGTFGKFYFVPSTTTSVALTDPSNLTATADSDSQISLSWDAATGATSYTVYRCDNAADAADLSKYTVIGTTTDTSYVDTGLTENATYYYGIVATDNFYLSNYINANATTKEVDRPFYNIVSVDNVSADAGAGFTATAVISNTGTANSDGDVTVTFTVNGANVTATIPAADLEIGEQATVTANLTAPVAANGATYDITVSVENATGTATGTGTLTVKAPILEVSSIGNVDATANTPFEVAIQVANTGDATLTAGQTIDVTFNGQTQQVVVPEIAAHGTATVYATFTAPTINGTYEVTSNGKTATVTVTGGAEPDDVDPYPDTPTKDPVTTPNFNDIDGLTYVSGPYYIRNEYTGFGYQYLYDSTDNNNFAGTEDGQNGADSSAYANYGYALRQVTTDDPAASLQGNQNYMWNIYSKQVGGTTYYLLRNVATGRFMHTGVYGDYYNFDGSNNALNTFAWNADLTNGANGLNNSSQANREMSYYAFTLPSYAGTNGETFVSQIVNQRYAWGNRTLHGELAGSHNTTERIGKVFFTDNNYTWGTKNWIFNPATVTTSVADLTITSASVEPIEIPFGSAMKINATISNIGNADIANGTPILVKFVFNGKLTTVTYTDGLAAGATADIEAFITPNKVTDGASMTATVNADWSLDESNFENNTYTVNNITVVDIDKPVLSVQSVSDASVAAGTGYTATAVIKNIGKLPQEDTYTVTFNVNGETKVITITDDLGVDETKTVTAEFTAPNAANGTTYPIKVDVANSSKSGTLTVLAPVLEIVSITDTTANASEVFQIAVNLKNSGGANLVAGQTIDVTFNGQTVQVAVPAIPANGSSTVFATFTAPDFNGSYNVTAGNATGKVTVVGGADEDTDPPMPTEPGQGAPYYVIQSVQRNTFLADTDLSEDGTIRVALSSSSWDAASADPRYQWKMVDLGNGKVYLQNVATGRYLQTDGDKYYGYDGTYNHNGVALVSTPDSTKASLTLTNTSTEGDGKKLYTMHDDAAFTSWGYYINTYHDNGKLQMSGANANNSTLFRFAEYYSTPGDLTVTNVAVNSTEIQIDDTLKATATIKNISNVDITEDIVVKFIFNGKITRVTYSGGLKAGATANVVADLPANKTTSGTAVTVTVNSDWAVGESDYTNNSMASELVEVSQGITYIDDFNRDTLSGLGVDVMAYEAAKDANGMIDDLANGEIVLDTTGKGAELYIGRILEEEIYNKNNYLVFKIKSSEPVSSGVTLANGYRDNLSDSDYKDLFSYALTDNSATRLVDGYQLVILDLEAFKLRLGTDEFPSDIFDLSMKFAADIGTISIDEIYLSEDLPEQPSNAVIEIISIDPNGTPDPVEMDASGLFSKNEYTFELTVVNNGTTDWTNPVVQYIMGGQTYTATLPEGTVVPADGQETVIAVTMAAPTTDLITEVTFVAVDDAAIHPTVSVPIKVNNVIVQEDTHGEAPDPIRSTYIIQSEQVGYFLYDDGYLGGYENSWSGVNEDNAVATENGIGSIRMKAYSDGDDGLPNGNDAEQLKFQWYLEQQGDGTYKITNAYTGRSIVTLATVYLGDVDREASIVVNGDVVHHANLVDVVPESLFNQTLDKGALNAPGSNFHVDYPFNDDSKYWSLEILDHLHGDAADSNFVPRDGYNDFHSAMYTNNIRYKVSQQDGNSYYWYYYLNSNIAAKNYWSGGQSNTDLANRLNISGYTPTDYNNSSFSATHFNFYEVPKGVDLEMISVELYDSNNERITSAIIKENEDDAVTITARATFVNNNELLSVPAGTVIDIKFNFDGQIICVPYTVGENGLGAGETITVDATFTTTKLYESGIPIIGTVNGDWNWTTHDDGTEDKTLVHDYDIIHETTYANNQDFDTLVISPDEVEQVEVTVDFYDSVSSLSGSTISLNGLVGPRTDVFTDVPANIRLTAEPASGYEFAGWYMGDILLTTNPTYTLVTSIDATYLAKFVPAKVTLTVDTDPANGEGGTIIRKQGEGLLDIPVETYPSSFQYDKGSTVRLVAQPKSGYRFVHWVDENNNEVSTAIDYTFVINNDMHLTAVFIPTRTVQVYFMDSMTGKQHWVTTVEAGSKVTYGGDIPYIDGYTWLGWEYDLNTKTFDQDTIVYTVYERNFERNHNLNILIPEFNSDGTSYNFTPYSCSPNMVVTVTTQETIGKRQFSYWRFNGQVLCLTPTFKLMMPDSDCTLEAVYDADDVDKYKHTYCVSFEGWISPTSVDEALQYRMFSLNAACVNEGDTLVQMGALLMVVNANEDGTFTVPTDMTLNTPGIKKGTVKSDVQANNGGDQYNHAFSEMYTIRLTNAKVEGVKYYTRAFIIYKDAAGVEHTVYADEIMDCSNLHETIIE